MAFLRISCEGSWEVDRGWGCGMGRRRREINHCPLVVLFPLAELLGVGLGGVCVVVCVVGVVLVAEIVCFCKLYLMVFISLCVFGFACLRVCVRACVRLCVCLCVSVC